MPPGATLQPFARTRALRRLLLTGRGFGGRSGSNHIKLLDRKAFAALPLLSSLDLSTNHLTAVDLLPATVARVHASTSTTQLGLHARSLSRLDLTS